MHNNEAAQQPYIYDSAHSGPAAKELRGVLRYRDLILQLIHRDIVTRYKRSVLGVAWTFSRFWPLWSSYQFYRKPCDILYRSCDEYPTLCT